MRRDVQPELLDSLPPAAPQALGSRADLRRLNGIIRPQLTTSFLPKR